MYLVDVIDSPHYLEVLVLYCKGRKKTGPDHLMSEYPQVNPAGYTASAELKLSGPGFAACVQSPSLSFMLGNRVLGQSPGCVGTGTPELPP